MKLELKHLASYLPYGLKGIDYDKKTYLFRGLDNLGNIYWDCNDILNKKGYDVKPILRPLSDLTKEIEVDSELTTISKDYSWGRFDEISTLKPHQLRFIQLREYELLLEYHFDFFGLIEKGLAIDINTL